MGFQESAYVRYERRDGAAWIVIDRGEKRNALTTPMYAAVRDAFRRAEHDEAVDIVVVTGAGGDFSVGGDLGESGAIAAGTDDAARYVYVDSLPYETMRSGSKTSVAVVDGYCLGGALALAAATDLIVASDRALFGLPEARSGYSDPWGPEFLAPRISRTHVNYLVHTGEFVDAEQALAWGMVNRVVAVDELERAATDMIAQIRQTAPAGRAGYKRYVTRDDRITAPAAAAVVRSGGADAG